MLLRQKQNPYYCSHNPALALHYEKNRIHTYIPRCTVKEGKFTLLYVNINFVSQASLSLFLYVLLLVFAKDIIPEFCI